MYVYVLCISPAQAAMYKVCLGGFYPFHTSLSPTVLSVFVCMLCMCIKISANSANLSPDPTQRTQHKHINTAAAACLRWWGGLVGMLTTHVSLYVCIYILRVCVYVRKTHSIQNDAYILPHSYVVKCARMHFVVKPLSRGHNPG